MDVKNTALRNLNRGRLLNDKMQKTMEKLSSGFRINRAADDAAGLAVSEKLRLEMSEQTQCVQNVKHGTNLARTADAALQEVNDMMKRAETLCLQAENGTYSELERQELSDELNALYDEMERIFESSQFSDVKLFQYKSPEDVGDYPRNEKEYIEAVQINTPDWVCDNWGKLVIVKDREFAEVKDTATPATATLQLGDDVDMKDASTLNGKGFYIKPQSGSTIYVSFSNTTTTAVNGNYRVHDDGKYYYDFVVPIADCTTVEQAMQKLCRQLTGSSMQESVMIQDAKVSAGGQVTFTFGTKDLPVNYGYPMKNGDGTLSNGVVISCAREGELKVVDEGANTVEKASGTLTINMLKGDENGMLTAAEKTALQYNSIYVAGKTIQLLDLISGKDLDALTVTQVREALAQRINDNKDAWKMEASLDGGSIKVTSTEGKFIDFKYSTVSIGEATSVQSNQNGQRIIPGDTTQASTEKGEVYTFSLSPATLPLTLKINNKEHTFYNSADYRGMSLINSSNTTSTSESRLLEDIKRQIVTAYGNTAVECKVENGAITVTGLVANKEMDFKNGIVVGGSTKLSFGNSMSHNYSFAQECKVELTIPADVSKLVGSGFVLDSAIMEFTAGDRIRMDSKEVNIGTCQTIDDVKNVLAAALPSGYRASVENGKLVISKDSSFQFRDGKTGGDGLFTADVTASGGALLEHPSATIDFSSYNSENFDELYGKGFRVTCATCEGEYINVIFCNNSAQEFDTSFDLRDEQGNIVKDQNGNDIKIRNCVVQLQDMTSGEDIVRSIVAQLSAPGVLDHYTEVRVGTPASVLVVQDKRVGNLKDEAINKHYRAQILSGVKTNCKYDLTILEHTNPANFIGGPETNTTAYYGYCPIYAGESEGKADWINVHLPNLSLNLLNLDPPRPDLTKVESIEDVRSRLRVADNVISMARGQLGADQNRLDHARNNLSAAVEETSSAYSRIRDTDMAEMMTEQVKLSILQQSQQSALAHIHQRAAEVLKLMQ